MKAEMSSGVLGVVWPRHLSFTVDSCWSKLHQSVFVFLEDGCEIRWLALMCEGCWVSEQLWRSQTAMVWWQQHHRTVSSHESQADDPGTSFQDIIFVTQITTVFYLPVGCKWGDSCDISKGQIREIIRGRASKLLLNSVSHSQDFIFR